MLKILRLLRLARIAYKLELLTQSGVAQKLTYKSISFHEVKNYKISKFMRPLDIVRRRRFDSIGAHLWHDGRGIIADRSTLFEASFIVRLHL